MVNNFLLSLLILKVNFSLPADDLSLVAVITLPPKPQFTEITTVFYIGLISSYIFLQIFPRSPFLGALIFHSDTQARLQFWDTEDGWQISRGRPTKKCST